MIDKKYINAYRSREYSSFFPENPKQYEPTEMELGKDAFESRLNIPYSGIDYSKNSYVGDEVSPFTGNSLGIEYQIKQPKEYIQDAQLSKEDISSLALEMRFEFLEGCLNSIRGRFFEIAFATMHTTGQSFMMSFQASGPHAADRALEAMVASYIELTSFDREVEWKKDFGKFELQIKKDYLAIGKGIGLVIGCSTFPTWNSVTGIFANLMCGNPVIVKPHPSSILPIAIFIDEIRKNAIKFNLDPNLIQLAADSLENPITKELAESPEVKLIDYTGGNSFGDYIEALPNKITFTEKAGVNCCILDSVKSFDKVTANIAFSVSLYSGQMCTAPQNIFVPEDGIKTDEGIIPFDEVVQGIKDGIEGLVNHPKAGPNTLGAIQSPATLERVKRMEQDSDVVLESVVSDNPEFEGARIASPIVLVKEEKDYKSYAEECFGPIVFIIKTKNINSSIELAQKLASDKGALTCLCYTTDDKLIQIVRKKMNSVFVPVSFNFTGAGFVNQHAAFSDLHVTGGNAAGNATFTNSEYISKRFVWVGNRYM